MQTIQASGQQLHRTDFDETSKAWETIHQAWKVGRRIVPLFGSGISVSAGIPVTAIMTEYMDKVEEYFSSRLKKPADVPVDISDIRNHLMSHDWPDPHELNWWLKGGGISTTLKDEKDEANKALRVLGMSPWLHWLERLCGDNQVLKDQFFERFERGRRPALSHHFIAYLSALMDWRLILTTNFDTLIEEALREQSLDPRVYEIPEQGPMPDARLVANHLSLIKLHGGAFARRMSGSLRFELSADNLRVSSDYFPKDALLLV
jgi:hypothetical protein